MQCFVATAKTHGASARFIANHAGDGAHIDDGRAMDLFEDFYITTCAHCGGAVRIVASIEDPKAIIEEPTAIRAILAHFEKHGALEQAHYRPAARAPPPAA